MLGPAALAMWWDMAAEMRDEFEHWHSHEHFGERLALPGFVRASRWADAAGGEGFFVLYELATYEALSSPEYLARLNAPSDWSRTMMPHHRHMVRSRCRVMHSRGSAVAAHAITVRLSPAAGEPHRLEGWLATMVQELPSRPGVVGAHLLRSQTPADAATTEQRLRGLADRAADWIVVVTGYDARATQRLAEGELAPAALEARGAAPGAIVAAHALRHSALAARRGHR